MERQTIRKFPRSIPTLLKLFQPPVSNEQIAGMNQTRKTIFGSFPSCNNHINTRVFEGNHHVYLAMQQLHPNRQIRVIIFRTTQISTELHCSKQTTRERERHRNSRPELVSIISTNFKVRTYDCEATHQTTRAINFLAARGYKPFVSNRKIYRESRLLGQVGCYFILSRHL